MRSAPSGSPVPLDFWCHKCLMGAILSRKSWVQKGRPPVKIAELHTFRLITRKRNKKSTKVQLTRIESRTWAFQRAINQGRASILIYIKWSSDVQICVFSKTFWQKPLKVCYKVSLSKNFQRQSCSAINYLSNGYQHSGRKCPARSGKI